MSILLDVQKEGSMELDVSYVVTQASWTPSYDVRVYSDEKTMKAIFFLHSFLHSFIPSFMFQVYYYGMIKQNSGEDWIDAKLSLTTAQPSIGGQVPELKTMRVSFYRPP